ncbi:MAG: hypothetical protein ACOCWQ_03555, partial [Nanoarchaeota archaeon]
MAQKDREKMVPNYRVRRFKGHVLLTSDYGTYHLLSSQEYSRVEQSLSDAPDVLVRELRQKGLIIDEQNADEIADRLAHHYSFLDPGPSLHIVVPTAHCD